MCHYFGTIRSLCCCVRLSFVSKAYINPWALILYSSVNNLRNIFIVYYYIYNKQIDNKYVYV